ncbi:MAG: response regulator [Bacteroidales bacterium]
MATIRILLVEDEMIIAEDLKIQLQKLGYAITGIAKSYEKALELINAEIPDLMLVDIILKGEKDGITLAEKVQEKHDIPLIFLTSHADKNTVERAKKVHPNGYLIKPYEREDLYTAIEIAFSNYIEKKSGKRASEWHESNNTILENCIFVKQDHLLIKIPFDELEWIKSERNYLELHCCKKNFLIRSTLSDFLLKLPQDQFLQVHRSYAVNISHISAIQYHCVQLGEQEIPLGRSYFELLKEKINIVR